MKRTTLPLAVFVLLWLSTPALAQYREHVFPQFADGKAADGSYYRSTLTILPWTWASSTPQCEFTLYGMETTFETGAFGYYFSAEIPLTNTLIVRTTGVQPLRTGHATLICTEYVYANVTFTYYSRDNRKISEATVFSTPESNFFRIPFDARDGIRQGLAIANSTGFNRGYVISLFVGNSVQTAYVVVPAQRNLAKFIDELMPVTAGTIGMLTIRSTDYSYFSTIGMRVTGNVFSTIPPGN